MKKIILIINEYNYSLKKILKKCKIKELKPKRYEEITNEFSEDILVVNININYIEKLGEIIKNIKPDIIFIPGIEDMYTERINKKEFEYIKKGLKKYKNKILIINDNDKYLSNIFNNKIDIYRYGKHEYDDIKYEEKGRKLILNYLDKEYIIESKKNDIIGNIIIGLLFGKEINKMIDEYK